jgi:chromate transporter
MLKRIFRTIPILSMSEIEPSREKVSLFELARTFNHIALASFGGGLSAWSREVLVVEKHWMDEEEFLSAMTMCRILPGANQVNMAVFVGTKMGGIPGALAALFGLCLMPVIFILAMGYMYFRFKEVPALKGALHGASAAAVALTFAMVIKTGQKCLTGVVPVLLFLASFVLSGLVRWPLPLTLAVLAPLSLFWAWPRKAAA